MTRNDQFSSNAPGGNEPARGRIGFTDANRCGPNPSEAPR